MRKRRLPLTLALLLTAATALAQQWTVIELPATAAELPALIEQQFGCTYEELPEKHNITHLRFTGTDFNRDDYDMSGQYAIRYLVQKAKVIDLSQVMDNEQTRQWYAESYYYQNDYPGPDHLLGWIPGYLDSLEHFIFPKTLTRINCYLSGDTQLKQVTWPDHVEQLQESMFQDCTSLETMDIPATVSRLPSRLFRGCGSLTSVTLHQGLTTIGESCFQYCEKLKTVAIPSTVTTLEGGSIFSGCKALERITLPEGIVTLPGSTFDGCTALKSVSLPSTITEIGGDAFSYCESLPQLTLPQGVTTIGTRAFEKCTALKQISLPQGLTTIGEYAFHLAGLEQVDMPDAVISLGEGVFYDCAQLQRAKLSRSLTAIAPSTFYNCAALQQASIPMRVTRIENWAFSGCTSMASPTLPDGLTFLGKGAFCDCRFDHVTLPSSLQQIGDECFRSVPLRTIDVPASVVEIGANAFSDNDQLQTATLHEGLLFLQQAAFEHCTQLGDVRLPNSLRVLGDWTFHDNKQRKSYTQPPLISVVPAYICFGCENLTSVTLHDGVTAIGGSAFRSCTSLTHINLPEGLREISDWAFESVPLTKVTIPLTVKVIAERAFNAGNYERIVLPEGVEEVGARAFYSEKLRYVDFPSTIRRMGEWPFHGDGNACDSIVLRTPLAPQCTSYNYRSWDDGALYVPPQSVDRYRQDENFSGFTNIRPLTGYTPHQVVVANTANTAETGFPLHSNADLTVTHSHTSSNNFQGGHLTVDGATNWNVAHLRYDYQLPWHGWERDQFTATLINEGRLSAQTMEMDLSYYANEWFFFTPPFDMRLSDLTCSDPRTPFVVRTFDGAQRAAGNHYRVWQDVPANATLEAGRGYIMQYGSYRRQRGYDDWVSQSDGVEFSMQSKAPLRSPALSSEAVSIPLTEYKGEYPHNEGWNLVGNPFMAYYDISQMEGDAPILVATKEPFTALTAYSPLDDQFILRPLQAFLVQRSNEQTAVTFNPEGRQESSAVRPSTTNSARAMRRTDQRRERVVYNLSLSKATQAPPSAPEGATIVSSHDSKAIEAPSGAVGGATRLVVTPRATAGYDRGHDAPFLTLSDTATALYTRSGGLRYSLNEQPPTTERVDLGMHLSQPGTYTISATIGGTASLSSAASGLPAGPALTLLDQETGAITAITEAPYTFTIAEPATLNNRFVLLLPAEGITSVTSVAVPSQQAEQLYDLQGRQLKGESTTKGFYIKNGKKYIHY